MPKLESTSWSGGGGGSSLPDQTGHAGQYLTTDGSAASWAAVSAGYSGTDEAWVSYGGSPAGGGKTVIHWQVTDRANGTALTYTSDGTNGDSITVNTDGIYAVQISGQCITATTDFYCTRNLTAGEKTNPPYFVSNAKVLCTSTVNSNIQSGMYVGHLAAGDVLYTQTDANADQIVADRYLFWRVTRIA